MSPPQNKTILPSGEEMICGIIERSDEEVSNTEAGKRAWTVQMCE
jgi:hypothetical protein